MSILGTFGMHEHESVGHEHGDEEVSGLVLTIELIVLFLEVIEQ